jgi:DNA-directed RNA polymerase specialized sigma24 family protein
MSGWPEGVDERDVYDIIDGVVASLTRKYRSFVKPDDVRQELRLQAWKKRDKFAEYLTREDEGKRRAGEAAFMKSMHRYGDRWCRREKARISGYDPGDEYFYPPALIEQLIAAHGQGLTSLAHQGGEKRTTDPAEGGNLVVMIFDVTQALDVLDGPMRALLFEVFADGVPVAKIANREGVSEQAVRQKIERALRKLVQELGGDH